MWEPAMDARRYRWRYRWIVAWEAEGGRAGQTVELIRGEDRRWRSVGTRMPSRQPLLRSPLDVVYSWVSSSHPIIIKLVKLNLVKLVTSQTCFPRAI